MNFVNDTIVAQATPPGRGGVSILRLSGGHVQTIATTVLGKLPKPRLAFFGNFLDVTGQVLDQGLALFFPGPNSFTGEDVLELHAHGSPIVVDQLIKTIIQLNARLAKPGEFSERAFLNHKIDLSQAEAVADLIAAQTKQAARSALLSLQGHFSRQIEKLLEQIIELRMYVEAAIDFPEEEVDFLSDGHVLARLQLILDQLSETLLSAKQGRLLNEGMRIVLAGQPNVGKSSLLNRLSGEDTAIVSQTPGTTRDILRLSIHLDGLPIQVSDTAGLHASDDQVEQEGMRRARSEISKADCLVWVVDASLSKDLDFSELIWLTQLTRQDLPKVIVVQNKIDLLQNFVPKLQESQDKTAITLSAKTGEGLDILKSYLKRMMGYDENVENQFIARRRHVDALVRANTHLLQGKDQLCLNRAGELLAEELTLAHKALSEITGEFRSDDLLGKIFSTFCIGK